MRTIVYIDGFNLYYGCLKGKPQRWLDLEALFKLLLKPENEIVKIKYFTAKVKSKPNNLSAPQRQDVYFRALKAFNLRVSIYYGHFLSHRVRMPNANPPPNTYEVIKTEEKGSDVNLSVHLLNDAWKDIYDCAVVVSNDSDMAEAMRLVRQNHPQKVIGLFTPGTMSRTSEQLKKHAHFVKKIRDGAVKSSQLPDPIPDTKIRKPNNW
ncbi:MAG: NYN domain-containing protein [Paracoccaceae bacterium]